MIYCVSPPPLTKCPNIRWRRLLYYAQRRGIDLVLPTDVSELAGDGVAGWVDRKSVVVGGHSFVERQVNAKLSEIPIEKLERPWLQSQ